MPTYTLQCKSCKLISDIVMSFAQHDSLKLNDDYFNIPCSKCPCVEARRVYDIAPHGYSVNSENFGVHIEKNSKKMGKTKIDEKIGKKKENIPKKKENWYGSLPEDKQKDLFKSRKSKQERQKIATQYILDGK
jgi:hypothetical protein